MVNYANGKIYKIVSNQTDKCYVGSTTKKYLSDRMATHRKDYKRYQKGKYNYVTSYEIVKYDDAEIILLEKCPCESKEELHRRERYYIKLLDCVNKHTVGKFNELGKKEYLKQYLKQYIEDNKEHLALKKSYKHICQCGMQYTHSNKKRHERSKKHKSYFSTKEIIKKGLDIIKDLDKYFD